MGPFPKLTPMHWAAAYALVIPLGVGFAASPPAQALLGRLTPEQWAAWTQALGSIAAILAAIWIDRGSARRERVNRTIDDLQIANKIFGAVGRLADVVNELGADIIAVDGDTIELRRLAPGHLKRLRRAGKVVRYYCHHGIGEPLLVSALQVAEEHSDALETALEAFIKSRAAYRPLIIGAGEADEELRGELKAIMSEQAKTARRLAGKRPTQTPTSELTD